MPEVEKGIPCPYKIHPKNYKRKPSMWDSYLRKLEPGDSFLIDEHEIQNLQHIARQRQILISILRGPDEALKIWKDKVRVWVVPEEPVKVEKLVMDPTPGPERSPSPWGAEDVSLL